jgi:thiosulfate reductase/polysulfide reductase chain A
LQDLHLLIYINININKGMKKTSRRDFIKISALGAGGLALANPVLNWVPGFLPKEKKSIDESKAKRFPTFCEVCFWKCAGFTYLDAEGKIQKIIGNENDPHSNGRFCPRGTGGVGMYYDEDRLKTPLMRVVEDGKSTFKPVSWVVAFDFIAKK